MKVIAHRQIGIGLFLIAISGSLLGQTPATSGVERSSTPAVPTASSSTPSDSSVGKPHDDRFVIGKDDILMINVWKEQEISRSLPVRSDGRISLPLAGEVQAAGRTPLQLEEEITDKLRSYITEPEVTVMVQQINSKKFNILGQVAKPGPYPLTTETTILDAISESGGLRDFAKKKGIYVLRQGPNGAETRISFNYNDVIKGRKSEQNIKLQSNDTIVVP